MPAKPSTIWTIGHSTRALADFLDLLKAESISALADVRRFPGSRRYPHFGQEQLAAALEKEGIQYRHFSELGGRRSVQPDSPNNAWRNAAFRGYADYMMSQEFAIAIGRLTNLAAERPSAIMCAEALWWRCHRALIADFLKARSWHVLHILGPGKVQEHPFTSAAQLVNGRLSYRTEDSAPDLFEKKPSPN